MYYVVLENCIKRTSRNINGIEKKNISFVQGEAFFYLGITKGYLILIEISEGHMNLKEYCIILKKDF